VAPDRRANPAAERLLNVDRLGEAKVAEMVTAARDRQAMEREAARLVLAELTD
jgi:hypothetical protein